jgi:ABC-type enterochelin transport system permease subunit
MDDFRKPYEYEDEKGISGLLLVYFIMLLAEESLLGAISVSFGYNILAENRVLGISIMCISAFYMLFSVYSAVVLKLLKKYALKVSKIFLVFRFIYMIPYLALNTISQIKEIPYEKDYVLYAAMHRSIIISFIISISFIIVFSAGWYTYLKKSRKVKELFPDEAATPKASVRETARAHD